MEKKSTLLMAVALNLVFLFGLPSSEHLVKTSSAQTLIDYGDRKVGGDDMTPAAPERESSSCCQCVFDAGGRTIGGPACFEGDCDDVPNVIFETTAVRSVCLTVSNTGDCAVYVEMLKTFRSAEGGSILEHTELESEIVPGATKTLCAESVGKIAVRCRRVEDGFCGYRWRLDDADRE